MAIAFEYALTKRIRHGLRGQQRSKSNIFPVVWEYDIANPGSAPVIQQLPIPSGFFSATTTAVNDAGDVVGYAGSPNIDSHAVLWSNEMAIDLGASGPAAITVLQTGSTISARLSAQAQSPGIIWIMH